MSRNMVINNTSNDKKKQLVGDKIVPPDLTPPYGEVHRTNIYGATGIIS